MQVFVNGVWVGVHRNPTELVATLRHMRRQADVNGEVGIIHDIRLQELRIFTDHGRTSRPLFVVQDQQLLIRKSHIRRLAERDTYPYMWSNLVQTGEDFY